MFDRVNDCCKLVDSFTPASRKSEGTCKIEALPRPEGSRTGSQLAYLNTRPQSDATGSRKQAPGLPLRDDPSLHGDEGKQPSSNVGALTEPQLCRATNVVATRQILLTTLIEKFLAPVAILISAKRIGQRRMQEAPQQKSLTQIWMFFSWSVRALVSPGFRKKRVLSQALSRR